MYSLLNIVLTGWLLSASSASDGLVGIVAERGNVVAMQMMQQMIVGEEKKILALRAEAGDIQLYPPEDMPAIAATTVVAAAVQPPVVQSSITVLASPTPVQRVAAPVAQTPKPVAPRPAIVPVVTPRPTPVVSPAAIVAPVIKPTTAYTPVPTAPTIPPLVAPPVTQAPAQVTRPAVTVAPTPVQPVAAAPSIRPTTAPAAPVAQPAAGVPRINGPVLTAINSENIGTYTMSIPKLGLTNIPVNPTDARNDTKWKNDLKVGVGQLLCPPGTANCKTVIFGHSSNYASVISNFNQVFKGLINMAKGDEMSISFQGQTLRYRVTKTEVVGADTASIVTNYGREELVLFTCWPYMTSTNRAVVYLDRIY